MKHTRSTRLHVTLEEETDHQTTHGSPEEVEEVPIEEELGVGLEQSQQTSIREPVTKRRKTKAEYWDAYEEYFDENNLRRARCKYCKATYACDSNKNGTKNVKKHFENCKNNPTNKGKGTQTQLILEKLGDNGMKMKNWSFDANVVREAIVEMVIRDEMPYRCVEKDGLRNAFFAACPQFTMPSRRTIQRDCFKLYTREREKLKDFFANSCQRVCVTTDTWTSTQRDSYMCVTAHFIDNDWNLHKKVINFCLVTSHKGHDIGRAIDDCLTYWGLEKKLFTVTVDNASANDVACAYLSEMAKEKGCISEGKFLHVRCMAHILNLIVQDGIAECGRYVDKLRAVVKYVKVSPARKLAFKQLVEKCKVDCYIALKPDVCTRWNSTYEMLNSALPYKAVFSRMEIPRLDDSDLGPLSSFDWMKIEVLVSYLKEFYDLTNRISGSLYTTSNYLILHIARAMKVLGKLAASEDTTLNKMASEMKKKCDKYWGSFDKLNVVIFIPSILDPFCKLRGVTNALKVMYGRDNVEQLVFLVKGVAYELFSRYANSYASESQDVGTGSNPLSEDESSSWMQDFNEDDNLDRDDASRSEFDLYLTERNEPKEGDVLKWSRLNGMRYPILSRMARDVLAIPITTVPSESTFSTGGRHLTKYRSRLSPKNLQALVCTQDWLRLRTRTKKSKDNDDESEDESDEDENDEGTFYA